MNGNNALLDSNIIIYLSKREVPLSFLDQFNKHYISVITYMEVLGYKFRNYKEEKFIREMLEVFRILFIDQKIADIAIEIRRERQIKLPDAIIAATAKTLNLCLVTRNIDDFKKVEIQIANPFD
ncbi:MAG: type II toxin-antitoxin system VapC family toxin [Deltaproteobacteria bacterium]|jgi:predicted nucleic acid-binding protein|nr:type II toxin-antitoxin system VapC family toxin [Deltaproteobacteria bacterium]MBW2228637.1 type II toxin-antitoxin system VapC family toxin [Deltaproteobacteria bacterium]MBW2327376.1 type II toxin-antitoxin system VapC family toxin [Deltaproteobacteria bacterium]